MLSLIPLPLPPHLHPDLELRDVPGSGLCVDDSDDSEAEERDERDEGASKGHLEKRGEERKTGRLIFFRKVEVFRFPLLSLLQLRADP